MKLFTRIFILASFSLFFLQACMIDMHSVKGNGKIVNKEISISDYQEIVVSSGADVVYEQQSSKEPYLQICVDENIFPLLDVKSDGKKLVIKLQDNQNINPTRFTVYTNSVNLSKVSSAGSGEVHLKGEVNSKDLKIDLSGSGNILSDSLYCEKMSLTVTGSGGANLKGASNESKFEITGSGSIKALNFSVQDLACSITGSGGIQAFVGQKLNANITGSGNIKYRGNPQVSKKITGSGNVKEMD